MTDDELRGALRGADPARTLPDPDSIRIAELTAAASTPGTRHDTPLRAVPAAPSRPRSQWSWLVPAGVAAAGLAVAWTVPPLGGGPVAPTSPTAATSAPATPTATVSTTRLELEGADPMMSCKIVDAELIAGNEVAFAARVTSVTPDEVRLAVTRVFFGTVGEVVAIDPPELSDADFSGFEFSWGAEYLIAASAGGLPTPTPRIALCGVSGPADPALLALYEQAAAVR
jgi:hypothetical protein